MSCLAAMQIIFWVALTHLTYLCRRPPPWLAGHLREEAPLGKVLFCGGAPCLAKVISRALTKQQSKPREQVFSSTFPFSFRAPYDVKVEIIGINDFHFVRVKQLFGLIRPRLARARLAGTFEACE